jgi:hypothetical protein
MLTITPITASDNAAGDYYFTDISTFLFGGPINSINIGGVTLIDAEAMRYYGFTVNWHLNSLWLEIIDEQTQNVDALTRAGIRLNLPTGPSGTVAGQYFYTDIRTSLNGRHIASYNIGGRTFIGAEAMRDFGYSVVWDPVELTLQIFTSPPVSPLHIDLSARGITDEQLVYMIENRFIPPDVIYLNLSSNNITDVLPLLRFTDLEVLNLRHNPVNGQGVNILHNLMNASVALTQSMVVHEPVTAEEANAQLVWLVESGHIPRDIRFLTLHWLNLTDISPLANLTHLETLHMNGNLIQDLRPLASVPTLQIVYMKDSGITDLLPLSELTNLQFIDFSNSYISDLSPLANLTNLELIIMVNNRITDISPLANLTNLRHLTLNDNLITDISALSGLTNIDQLRLVNNLITDITPIIPLQRLWHLNVDGNPIEDFSPVAELPRLSSNIVRKYLP